MSEQKIRCRVINSLKVRLKSGEETTLGAGELLELPISEANRLMKAGRVRLAGNPGSLEKLAVLVYSPILEAHIWVVAGKKELEALRAQVPGPIYTNEEIEGLKKMPGEVLRRVNEVKTLFEGKVDGVEGEGTNNQEEEN
jgi:hypothetical protein